MPDLRITKTPLDDELFYTSQGFRVEHPSFHLRLGQLMHAFTMAEMRLAGFMAVMLNRALKPQPNPQTDAAFLLRGAYEGMRAKALYESLNRLLRNLRAPKKQRADVAAVLSHMASIQALRDLLAHRVVHFNNDIVVIDNVQIGKEPRKSLSYRTDLANLANATHDLLIIPVKLHHLLYTTQPPDDQTRLFAEAPWRYKHVLPDQR